MSRKKVVRIIAVNGIRRRYFQLRCGGTGWFMVEGGGTGWRGWEPGGARGQKRPEREAGRQGEGEARAKGSVWEGGSRRWRTDG